MKKEGIRPPEFTEHFGFGQKERSLRTFRNGIDAQNNYAHGRAINLFERAYKSDRTFVLPLYEKSWSYLAMGRYREAAGALRTVISHYRDLCENYQRIDDRLDYKRETRPEHGLLFSLYENLVMLDALLAIDRDVREGVSLLQSYMSDQFLPPLAKTIVKAYLAGVELPGTDRKPTEETKRQVTRSLQALFISCNQLIIREMETAEDYHGVEISFLTQIKIINKYLKLDGTLVEFKRGIEMSLASLYYQERQTVECRRLLEAMIKQYPRSEEAKLLLTEMTKFN